MKEQDTTKYAAFGMVALIPGMQYMIERMQKELDEMRSIIASLQNGERPKRRRPPKETVREHLNGTRLASGWPADPEERKAEMKRRVAARKRNAAKAKPHPNSAASWWANASERQKKQRLKKMAAGRAAVMPSVRLVNGATA